MIILFLIPVFVSLVLGVVFILFSSSAPALKTGVVALFALAGYLQFLTRFALAGLLLQVGLALGLAIWRRYDSLP